MRVLGVGTETGEAVTAVGRKHGPGAESMIAEAIADLGSVRAAKRQQEIDALPMVVWKGRTLYSLECQGTSGRGHHIVNVPLMMVWHLISLRRFFCPWHAGDAMGSARLEAARQQEQDQ